MEKNEVTDERILQTLGEQHKAEFLTNATLRRAKETEWIEDLRAAKGIYDPDVKAKLTNGKSSVYPKYTRSKEIPCVAKMNSLLFPTNDRNWSIEPTPKAQLRDDQVEEAIARVMQSVGGDPAKVTEDLVTKAVNELAAEIATRMQMTMDDQLTEMLFVEKVAKPTVRSGIRYGTGIIKGPLVESENTYEMTRDIDGVFKQVEKTVRKPFVENIQVWYLYPDMSTTDPDQAGFFYQLHPMTKHELRKLAKRTGFKKGIIEEYISRYPTGDYQLKEWEIDLQSIKPEEVKDNSGTKRYEVLERWGWVDGYDLRAAGENVKEEDLDREFYAWEFILGGKIIKLIKVDGPLYHFFYWDKDETSIFASGLPRTIRDTQITICSGWRAMLDNAAKVAGPITETNRDLLAYPEDADDFHPGKNFVREGRGAEANFPAIRAYNIESHITELGGIVDMAKRFGDEESALPAIVFGEPLKAGNETVGGLSIRSSNMNVTVGDVVKNFDACNESFLRALYKWNMDKDLNPDMSIKGDLKPKARGFASLLSKEARSQALATFMAGMTPADEPYIQRRWIRGEQAKALDLDPDKALRTEEEAQAIIASNRDAEAEALAKAQMAAEIEYTKSKAAKMAAGAEATGKKSAVDDARAAADIEHKAAQVDVAKTTAAAKVVTALRKPEKPSTGAKK